MKTELEQSEVGNGVFRCTSEVRFSVFTADCIMRNNLWSWNLLDHHSVYLIGFFSAQSSSLIFFCSQRTWTISTVLLFVVWEVSREGQVTQVFPSAFFFPVSATHLPSLHLFYIPSFLTSSLLISSLPLLSPSFLPLTLFRSLCNVFLLW